jgi:hypothetical protein
LERIKEKNGGKKFYFFSSRSGSAFYPLQWHWSTMVSGRTIDLKNSMPKLPMFVTFF